MKFKDRLKTARVSKGLSQVDLAKKAGIHITNISRYERGENKPTTVVLTKLADVLEVSTDFLMNGSVDEKANATLKNVELLKQFKQVEELPSDEQNVVLRFLGAYIRDFRTRQAYTV